MLYDVLVLYSTHNDIVPTTLTHSSNIEVINGGGFEPFSEEVLLHTGLSLEDGQWNGSLSDWSTLGFASNDKSTGKTSVFHHLVTKELRGVIKLN